MSQAHRHYFNNLADQWDQIMPNPVPEYLIEKLSVNGDDKILDVGAGTGKLSRAIEPFLNNNGSVIAVDIAEDMLKNGKFQNPGMSAACSDVCDLAFVDSYFDKIICFSVFPHIFDKERALEEFMRTIRPGGRLYIIHTESSVTLNDFHAKLQEPVCHDMLPSAPELAKLCEKQGFQLHNVIDSYDTFWLECSKS